MSLATLPPQRIGVFGGAFDPPHVAHVALARAAIAQLQLDALHIIPTGHAWHKTRTQSRHVFSKGIHLIVDRLTPNKRVLTFFADDGRLFFVIPMGPRTCIGTTDTKVDNPVMHVTAEDRALDRQHHRRVLSCLSAVALACRG